MKAEGVLDTEATEERGEDREATYISTINNGVRKKRRKDSEEVVNTKAEHFRILH